MHHLIDPKTGMPVKTDLAEVSVITDFALRGEVYAKCAMLLGTSAGLAFLESRAVRHAIVPAAGNGDGLVPAAA
jgi:thiamine biosynthesis lipoprotein